eukprot:2560283-Rhodomonas_salina.2
MEEDREAGRQGGREAGRATRTGRVRDRGREKPHQQGGVQAFRQHQRQLAHTQNTPTTAETNSKDNRSSRNSRGTNTTPWAQQTQQKASDGDQETANLSLIIAHAALPHRVGPPHIKAAILGHRCRVAASRPQPPTRSRVTFSRSHALLL